MWTEVKDPKGKWAAAMTDGYVPQFPCPPCYAKAYGDTGIGESQLQSSLTQTATEAKRDFHDSHQQHFTLRRLYAEISGGSFSPECDLLLLESREGKADQQDTFSGNTFKKESDSPNFVYVMQLHKDCPFYRECLLEVVGKLCLEPTVQPDYADSHGFQEELGQLAKEILQHHPSPEPTVEKVLQRHALGLVR